MSRPARSAVDRLMADATGSVAVEFSLVTPVLLALMLGGVDICRGLLAYRNLQQLTSSIAWTAKAQLTPATAKAQASLPASAGTVLNNTLFVTYGGAQSDLAVSVRYLVKPVGTAAVSDLPLFSAGTPLAANNTGIDTNLKQGDARIIVQASKSFQFLFGSGSLQLSARAAL